MIQLAKIFRQKSIYATLVFLAGSAVASAQSTEAIKERFDQYRKENLTEKIYLHSDKDQYLTGEVIWYKVYDVDGSFHQPLALSSVAYVELLDAESKQVASEKILLHNGFGDGSLALTASLLSGNYKLRCYTSWMKNSSAEYFFEKTITVVNPNKTIEKSTSTGSKDYFAGLYPEGGNLLAKFENRLAIKITDNKGHGINCSGSIKDESGNIVARFQLTKFGIGTCSFTPANNTQYKAEFNFSDGTSFTKAVPVVYSEGYAIKVVKGASKTSITVTASDSAFAASKSALLFVHCRNSIRRSSLISFTGNNSTIEFSNNELGDGINHITLFNEQNKPVCERLIFNYPLSAPELSVTTVTGNYSGRSKIDLVASTNAQTNSHLSLAVYKVDSLQLTQQSFIDDYLFLSSDLHGSIESPGWYFAKQNDEVLNAMDNLMLTNGWRRFNWENLLYKKTSAPKYIPELDGQFITGRIVHTSTGKPTPGITAFLTVPAGVGKFYTSVSDANGNISFLVTDSYGAPGIILQTAPADSMYRIEVNPAFTTDKSSGTLEDFRLTNSVSQTLTNHNIAAQVQQTYNSKYVNHFYNPTQDTLPFFNYGSEIYQLDDYTRFTTVEEILREYVPFVSVHKRSGKFQLSVYNDLMDNGTFDKEPMRMVDGLPIFNTDQLMQFDPLKFKQLDVYTRRYFYGKTIVDGIVNFTSYSKNLEGVQVDRRALLIDFASLQLQREFYAPEYATAAERSNHNPDFRYLLHWDPNVSIEKYGSKKLSFYSSDVKGKYIAVLQGITDDGKPCKAITDFEVE